MALSTKLKVALPLGTAITATAVTAYLIISTNNDLEKNKQADEALENLELTTKPFEEETIKSQGESEKEEKSATEQEDLEKKSAEDDNGPKEDKKEEAEAQDLAKILSNVEQDFKALAKADGGEEQVHLTLPESAKQGPTGQEAPKESSDTEEEEPQTPAGEKPAIASGEDILEPKPSLPERETRVSEEVRKSSPDEPELESPSEPDQNLNQEELGLETEENLKDEDSSSEEEEEVQESGGEPSESLESQKQNKENQGQGTEDESVSEKQEGQEEQSSSRDGNENNGSEDEGTQMTEEQIQELIDLQGKMASFSDRLSNLLQLRRFK